MAATVSTGRRRGRPPGKKVSPLVTARASADVTETPTGEMQDAPSAVFPVLPPPGPDRNQRLNHPTLDQLAERSVGVRVVSPNGAPSAPASTLLQARIPADLLVRLTARAEERKLSLPVSLAIDLEVFLEVAERAKTDSAVRTILNQAGYRAVEREGGALSRLVRHQVRTLVAGGDGE